MATFALQESEYIGWSEVAISSFKATDSLELTVRNLTSKKSGVIKVRDTVLFDEPQLRKQLAAFLEKRKRGWMVQPKNGYAIPIPTRSNKLAKYDLHTELVLRGLAIHVSWRPGDVVDGGVGEARKKKLGVFAFDPDKQKELFRRAEAAQKRMLAANGSKS